jgi:hypothetical protein
VNTESASRIRRAIASGEYRKAADEWAIYARELEACMAGGAGGPESGKPSLSEARELLEWSRRVVVCANAHTREFLNRLHIASSYSPPTGQTTVSRLITRIG